MSSLIAKECLKTVLTRGKIPSLHIIIGCHEVEIFHQVFKLSAITVKQSTASKVGVHQPSARMRERVIVVTLSV